MNKNIYIVEDNDDIRELVEFLLLAENYTVKGFSTVSAFKTQLEIDQPDLFLLDVMLPDGNGMDVCNQLKSDSATSHIPVLLMSANTNVAKISKQSEADDFIAKPFDIDDLIKRVNNLLN